MGMNDYLIIRSLRYRPRLAAGDLSLIANSTLPHYLLIFTRGCTVLSRTESLKNPATVDHKNPAGFFCQREIGTPSWEGRYPFAAESVTMARPDGNNSVASANNHRWTLLHTALLFVSC